MRGPGSGTVSILNWSFEEKDKVNEPNPAARESGKALIAEGKGTAPNRETFIYVNNRLEGNALDTIDGMLDDYSP